MIIEQHYDDEVLIGLLGEAEKDTHVPACGTCSDTLQSYRTLSSALHDTSVWDERELPETPSPKTANFIRSFVERSRAEDAAAAPIAAALIADPSAIDAHPEWRTAGVVRGLLKFVDSINFSDPKRAVEISTLAAAIAESLAAAAYASDVVRKLCALACREKAWALYFVGAFPESARALDRADEHLAGCSLSECDRAEIDLVRARLDRDLERFDDAVTLARRSASVFRSYGNHRRAAVAEFIESTVLVHLRRFEEALAIDTRMSADASLDEESRVCALNRTAYSLRELSRYEEAKQRYAQTIEAFGRLGLTEKRAMARWGFARVLVDQGNFLPAVSLLTELRTELRELGMSHDVALVSLDAAEALLGLQRAGEIAQLCREAIEYFSKAGLAYSSSAMTALAYLREAAEIGSLTPAAVNHVRTYFQLLPKQPHLLFAFPA